VLDGGDNVQSRRLGKQAEESLLEVHLRLPKKDFSGFVVTL
jgi:hypothetical protein